MDDRQKIIEKIFDARGENGLWKMLPETDRHYPYCLHYMPTFRATLWTLILLADLKLDAGDERVELPLRTVLDHFYDIETGVYSLKKDHFPIPCLNGNIIYLESYFTGSLSERTRGALEFFRANQRFDDGEYIGEKNKYCSNKSCYGPHTCYWGIVKLFKGLSFIPAPARTPAAEDILKRCVDFILLHRVCFSSRRPEKLVIRNIDRLTFPNMYTGDFLEILWLLKREGVRSERLDAALELLESKRLADGTWNLERKVNNLVTSIGVVDRPNEFVTERAREVMEYYAAPQGAHVWKPF
ncbi:MAG: hypothetical protein JW760_15300 [Spirochaetales bacterium]|nr:hypothetical protein [Spirochaetales bacterium]